MCALDSPRLFGFGSPPSSKGTPTSHGYQVPAQREPDPDPLVQHHPGHARAARAGAPPRHAEAGDAAGPPAALPHGAARAGDVAGALDRDPRRGPRDLPALAAQPALPRAPPREGAEARRPRSTTSTRASRRPAPTSPTPPCRRPTTTSSSGTKRIATETGAGQWGSSMALACQMFGLECTVYMVKVSFTPEALPQEHDAALGRQGPRLARPTDQRRPRASWPATRTTRARSASPSPRRSRTPPPTTTPTTPSAACSTTSACTRPSSARRPRSS